MKSDHLMKKVDFALRRDYDSQFHICEVCIEISRSRDEGLNTDITVKKEELHGDVEKGETSAQIVLLQPSNVSALKIGCLADIPDRIASILGSHRCVQLFAVRGGPIHVYVAQGAAVVRLQSRPKV
jgi:hypothetical protein